MAKTSPDPSTFKGGKLLVPALLTPAVVLPLCVPLYGRLDPTFIGFPFFFWFQFALIITAAALTVGAHVVARSVDRRNRAAHGLPPDRDGNGAPGKDSHPR
jgi:hypothetical protein